MGLSYARLSLAVCSSHQTQNTEHQDKRQKLCMSNDKSGSSCAWLQPGDMSDSSNSSWNVVNSRLLTQHEVWHLDPWAITFLMECLCQVVQRFAVFLVNNSQKGKGQNIIWVGFLLVSGAPSKSFFPPVCVYLSVLNAPFHFRIQKKDVAKNVSVAIVQFMKEQEVRFNFVDLISEEQKGFYGGWCSYFELLVGTRYSLPICTKVSPGLGAELYLSLGNTWIPEVCLGSRACGRSVSFVLRLSTSLFRRNILHRRQIYWPAPIGDDYCVTCGPR